jgi:tyrosine-protein phosphatase non-receptor type 13 protein
LQAIVQKEHIEENFMLGLSALIAGDFVFLPSDTRICKAVQSGSSQNAALTLFMRVRFFLPSLRGIRGPQARHLLYLQLRRSILEHQLPCSFSQLIELDGLALQAEFGNYSERVSGETFPSYESHVFALGTWS